MDENNQYGHAMTKPLPYGCIKRKLKPPPFHEFNKILNSISHEDKMGRLFLVDIKFNSRDPKHMLFNEIYPPVFKKNKENIELYERSSLQLMSVLQKNDEKDKINTFHYTSKTHSTMEEKKVFSPFISLIKRAGWLVTKIYEHYTFEQSKFKKEFVIMNQKSKQKSSTSAEKDFFKLPNNSNFGKLSKYY